MIKFNLDNSKIEEARRISETVTKPIYDYIYEHSSVTIERATLRLIGVDGADENLIPYPNIIVDSIKDNIENGVVKYFVNGLIKLNCNTEELCKKIAKNEVKLTELQMVSDIEIEKKARELTEIHLNIIKENKSFRENKQKEYKEKGYIQNYPMIYVIVATGNIYEDVKQAQSAAVLGADIIAVIRTTAQSLLDYVPYGATTEGFGGTYATQENFKIMRKALDEVSEELGRYVLLVNYCSGLCMPEIAAMGALERLDMMLNDSMYGILFRDINMYRTFLDQHFSRMINSYSGIIINTGEDNYLTTSDAIESAHTVLASQFINERFAFSSGMPSHLQGLGHAFEMDPEVENTFLYELSQAIMVRQIFPECPLKYMPPTKFMTGNIFKGHVMDAMFNLTSVISGQTIQLLGMMTEAIHTPFIQDRYLAVENAKYIFSTAKDLKSELTLKPNGIMETRAKEVLDKTLALLRKVEKIGLIEAIGQKMFADIKRTEDGGKGLLGVFKKSDNYFNPVYNEISKSLNVK